MCKRWLLPVCLVGLLSLSSMALGQAAGDPVPHENVSKPSDHPDASQPAWTPMKEEAGDQEDEGFALKRMQWFEQQRAYPNEHIPEGARWGALEQTRALRAGPRTFAVTAGPHPQDAFTATPWTFDGPQPFGFSPAGTPYSGRATCIAIDPVTPSTIYLGTAGGGVWKTTDSGATWKPMSDGQASLAIGALAVDPANPNLVYAGTGEPNASIDSYYGQGLLKSTNGGTTWTLIRAPFTTGTTAPTFAEIAIQPGNSAVLIAGTGSGVFRSADSGVTWARTLNLNVTGITFDKGNSSIAYAGINPYYSGPSATSAVYKSTNGGLSWVAVQGTGANVLPAPASVFRTAVIEDSSGANLYAAMGRSDFGAPGFLYKSTDGGANWTKLSPPSANDGLDWYRTKLAVVPNTNPNVLYATGAGLYQSMDGGVTWTRHTTGTEWPDQHGFAASADGSKLYLVNDGGVFVTQSPASLNPVFNSLNATIGTMTFYPGFSLIPGIANSLLAGTQDHGLEIYNNAQFWTFADNDRFCGDGGGAYVDPQNSHVYAHCQGGSANWVSNASGATSTGTYVSAQVGINFADRIPWYADIKGDPENIAIVYTATNHLYQSTNYAAKWTSISPDLTNGGVINTIAVAPTNSNVVYTGSGDGVVEVTVNALAGTGATWTRLTGLPNRSITKIVVMQDSPQDVYVVVGGFGTGHVFHSTNGGTNWTDISGNLPNTQVNSIAVDPALRNTIYVASDTGVYYTIDGGATWAVLGAGLPNVVVQDLLMNPTTRQLRIITHGRGAWDLSIPAGGFVESAPSLSFAAQTTGTTSAAQTVIFSNNFASTAVPIGSIAATGNFAQTNTCGASLAAGATCSASVTFAPASVGPLTGTLTLVSSSGNLTVTLSGIGLSAPAVTLSATSLNFSQAVGIAAAGQTVTLSNTGGTPLTGIAVSIGGANGGDFSQANTCAATLAAGANCTLSVVFTPAATGGRSAAISIADNAAGSPQTVALAGTGLVPYGLSFGSASATVTAGSTAAYTGQVTASAGTTLSAAVQMSCSGAPSLASCTVSPASIAAGGAGQAFTVNVSTSAATTGSLERDPLDRPGGAGSLAALAGLAGLGLLVRRRRRLIGLALILLCGLDSAALLSGCMKTNSVSSSPGTPKGTYTLTVTAQTAIYTTTQNVTLIVQ